MKYLISILFSMFIMFNSFAQQIKIDENFDDWNHNSIISQEDPDDVSSSYVDFSSLKISSTVDYLYINFTVDRFLNLQNYNKIKLLIDSDNNENTGRKYNGIGVDIEYSFGEREGKIIQNGVGFSIQHDDIGMMVLPTVSSDQFELLIDRKKKYGGSEILNTDEIKVILVDDRSNGDKVPNSSGGLSYSMSEIDTELGTYHIDQDNTTDFRVLSYNVLKDDMFESNKQNAYKHIFKTIKPDIIGLVEVVKHTAKQTKEKIADLLDDNSQWYYSKSTYDAVCVSKYPIKATRDFDGNAAFLIDYNGQDLVFIVAHLRCCNKDDIRQEEVDRIMSFIRSIKDGNSGWSIDDNAPIIITGDMNFVGDNRQRKTLLTGDIKNENKFGQDFNPDWDGSALEDCSPPTTGIPSTITWYDEGSSYNPGRLDYIIYSGSVLELLNSYVLFTPKLPQSVLNQYGLESDDTVWASDHMPVVADFKLIPLLITEDNNIKNKFSIFPNPAFDFVEIDIQNLDIKDPYIEVIDAKGKSVLQTNKENLEMNNFRIELNEIFQSGVYYILISDIENNKYYSRKLIVLKN